MSFRLVPKSVTLNNLERHNAVILRYFSEFGQLPGALRKKFKFGMSSPDDFLLVVDVGLCKLKFVLYFCFVAIFCTFCGPFYQLTRLIFRLYICITNSHAHSARLFRPRLPCCQLAKSRPDKDRAVGVATSKMCLIASTFVQIVRYAINTVH